jgi:hypothetical protein
LEAARSWGINMKYHGKVLPDDGTTITIEGEIGYGRVCTLKIEANGIGFIAYLDPQDAREIARHMNAAAELADRPVATV